MFYRNPIVHACKQNMALRSFFICLGFLALLWCSAPANADMLRYVPEISPTIKAMEPYGMGSYTFFIIDVFDITLWTDAESWSYDRPFALSMTYKIDIDQNDLVDHTADQMLQLGLMNTMQLDRYKKLLARAYPSIQEKDRFTALYLPGKGARFYLNGQLFNEINDMLFAKAFFDLWLSQRAGSPELRDMLLQKTL